MEGWIEKREWVNHLDPDPHKNAYSRQFNYLRRTFKNKGQSIQNCGSDPGFLKVLVYGKVKKYIILKIYLFISGHEDRLTVLPHG